MRSAWWQLPGPSRFIGRVAQDLQDGKNVVICLPQHFPDGLAQAIRAQVEVYENWPWYTLRLNEIVDMNPAHFLFSTFVRADIPSGLCTAATLVHEDAFAGRIIWVNGITAATRDIWCQFISEYTHACRTRPVASRTVFALTLAGDLARNPPGEDICLAMHMWRAVVSRLDMLMFAAGIFPDHRTSNSLMRQIAIASVANIALWDPTLTEVLVDQPLEIILHPHELLAEIFRQRCWSSAPPLPDAWYCGATERIDGINEIHSAMCVGDTAQRKIERRIWSAQVGTLFPFVEEQRQDLLMRLRRHLRLPFMTTDGAQIEDLQDLEIGHIHWQLSELRRQGLGDTSINLDAIIDRVNTLRLIRNDLAHLKCVSAERIKTL